MKGINRNPKSYTDILSNIRRFLEHLRSLEKINSRYLWAEQQIIEGNSDILWGLLDDLWCFYHNKSSPYDSSQKKIIKNSLLPMKTESTYIVIY